MDARATASRIRTASILGIVGTVVLLGSVPVLLLGLSETLFEFANLTRAGALGASAVIGLVVSAALAGLAWYQIRDGISQFDRSRSEFQENLNWIKASLRGARRDEPDQASPAPRSQY